MSDGPVIIYDKSTIQALNAAEAFALNCHFQVNVVPIFLVEVLADLQKSAPPGRTPEKVVGKIAAKISGRNAYPNVHHLNLCIGELLGRSIKICGVPVVGGGELIRGADGKTTMFFDEPPEVVALRRWRDGDFQGVERDFATAWRSGLEAQDLEPLAAAIRPLGKSPLKDLADVRQAANLMSLGTNGKRYKTLKMLLGMLAIPPQFHASIIGRWKAVGGPPMHEFAPYAAHVFRVDLFFYLGMAAHLIPTTRPSHRIDLAYLYYLPFCQVFSSSDKFHTAIVPLFIEERQTFVSGADLKADLKALAARYAALPAEERAKGSMTYAANPPRDGDFLVSRLFDRFRPGWRDFADDQIVITPEISASIMKQLGPTIDAIELAKRTRQ